ncbi:DUF6126 family protein [Streptomyces noursei]|uniref:DUF6126 family protein n=1 Tax=Streptomyces noursei TaxID=1971 RepID=UPI00167A7560|nr:DUF6126 family protein [Streptomyces noursei]MCZ1013892.1 hypothetical protein [Streptomyces noursei]GGX41065.1 hypothetical protein GCM10010341_73840 [Streptomyces noursei]
MSGAPRRKGPPPWRAVRSRTCIPTAAARACRGRRYFGRGPLRPAGGHGRACPKIAARHLTSPRCGVRRARATAVRPGTRLARLPAAVLVTQRAAAHEAARRSLWIRVLLHVAVTQLVLVFLALVVYLGRHAGT